MDKSDRFSEAEVRQRLHQTVQGAFAGPPTQLKDIPKKNGESRAIGPNGHPRRKQKRSAVAKIKR
jgi:hypothetical protein